MLTMDEVRDEVEKLIVVLADLTKFEVDIIRQILRYNVRRMDCEGKPLEPVCAWLILFREIDRKSNRWKK